ncbi:MAG: DUF2190 family protein [Kaiparowitsia implicata GSE-PSE-MK54-09C]|jgi:hypothetical protein|nr:DUF2190 family protein [Kaiparowitsia implicata GSE-PSE-MK54-09C]
MSNRDYIQVKNYETSAAVGRYRIVKFDAADGVVIQAAAATDALIGVSTDIATAVGRRCDVVHSGIAPVIYGGTVTRGALLTSDADGKAIATTTAGNRTIGIALVSGVADDIGSVLLSPGAIGAGV